MIQGKELLEKLIHYNGPRSSKSAVNGDSLLGLWKQEQAVAQALGTPMVFKAYVLTGPWQTGAAYAGYYGPGKPIQILQGRPINGYAYSGAHELGHLFDKPETILPGMQDIFRDEIVAESVAYILLHDKLPMMEAAVRDYFIGSLVTPEDVEVWWPRALQVASAIEKALLDPLKSEEVYKGVPSAWDALGSLLKRL